MVGLPSTTFNTARAFVVWGVLVGVLALWLLVKTVQRSSGYQSTTAGLANWLNPIAGNFRKIPNKYCLGILLAGVAVYPLFANNYMIDVGITCLVYIVLGLGLNIVVGLAGLLDLGYIAFYAVGAYTYSLLNLHFGLSFWLCLPIGIVLGYLELLRKHNLPSWLVEWLDLIPAAILSALLLPELVTSGAPRTLDLLRPELVVAVPTFLFAIFGLFYRRRKDKMLKQKNEVFLGEIEGAIQTKQSSINRERVNQYIKEVSSVKSEN